MADIHSEGRWLAASKYLLGAGIEDVVRSAALRLKAAAARSCSMLQTDLLFGDMQLNMLLYQLKLYYLLLCNLGPASTARNPEKPLRGTSN